MISANIFSIGIGPIYLDKKAVRFLTNIYNGFELLLIINVDLSKQSTVYLTISYRNFKYLHQPLSLHNDPKWEKYDKSLSVLVLSYKIFNKSLVQMCMNFRFLNSTQQIFEDIILVYLYTRRIQMILYYQKILVKIIK